MIFVPVGGGSGAAGACSRAPGRRPGDPRDRGAVVSRAGRLSIVEGGPARRGPNGDLRRGTRQRAPPSSSRSRSSGATSMAGAPRGVRIEHGEIVDAFMGPGLALRDRDNIQLEFFVEASP